MISFWHESPTPGGQQCDFVTLSNSSAKQYPAADFVSGRAFTGRELVTARRKEKKNVAPSSGNTTGGLFNGVPQGGRSKRAKHVSLEEKKGGKWCWLWSLHCFSSSHEWGVRWFLLGVRLTFWFRCCTFDFDVNPCNFPPAKRRRLRHTGGGTCDLHCALPHAASLVVSWDRFKVRDAEHKWSITQTPPSKGWTHTVVAPSHPALSSTPFHDPF